MSRVRIVTDSAISFLTPGFASSVPLAVVPHLLDDGVQTLEERPDMERIEYEELFRAGAFPPRVVPPSEEAFAEAYSTLQEETDSILSIHSSSALTGAYANARAASEQFLGRCTIQVIDSLTISVGLGLLVEAAVRAEVDGASFEDMIRILRGMIARQYSIFFLHDMAYLERGGLVSRSQAILGNMLGIIPFVTLEEGRLIPMEKVRNRPRALEKVLEFVAEFSELQHLSLLQDSAGPSDDTRWLEERLNVMHPETEITLATYGPTAAALVGLGSLGVTVLESGGEE